MKNKISFRDWHNILRDTRHEVEKRPAVLVCGEKTLSMSFSTLLGPGAAEVFERAEMGDKTVVLSRYELVILLMNGQTADGEVADVAQRATRTGAELMAFVDVSGLTESAARALAVQAELSASLSPGQIGVFSDAADSVELRKILKLILDRIDGKSLSLAALVPAFRPLVVKSIIDEIAGENGIVGAVAFLPASDMPVMTANQMRMIMKIAAAFGVTLSLKRAKELLVVVGGGFTFRAVARQLVGLAPVAGWAVKGAIAYTGTRAMGALAAKYFSELKE